mmetsp:Transcript_2244/g.5019  ORF Transcript_2244/g.5019 Transcript_2244/m.5019 type:complete len:616 (+) Transcript_2244:33-1880(+)
MEEAVEVMKSLCYELRDMHKCSPRLLILLEDNMDVVVNSLAHRTNEAFTQAAEQVASRLPFQYSHQRHCKYCVSTLHHLFNSQTLAQSMREDTLHNLVPTLLVCIVDERLMDDPVGGAMLEALALLLMRVLEQCNQTDVLRCLMELLLQPDKRLASIPPVSGRDTQCSIEGRWYDLVVKCMIKATKSLASNLPNIDVRALLLAIHAFFDALGGEEIRRRGAREDKPLRMVKTVLHELCKLKGADIYSFARDIPGADLPPSMRPIIFPYMDLNLQTMGISVTSAAATGQSAAPMTPKYTPVPGPGAGAEQAAGGANGAPATSSTNGVQSTGIPSRSAAAAAPGAAAHRGAGAVPDAGAGAPTSSSISLQPSDELYRTHASDEAVARSVLAAIFKRIAEKDNQALVDLHYFMQHNPHHDVDSMLSSASSTFKSFIQRGLHKVRIQMMQQQAAASSQPQQQPAAGPAASSQPQQQQAAEPKSWGSPDGEAVVNASKPPSVSASYPSLADKVAALSANPDRPASPMSPARGRIGEDKMAELRERMKQMQVDYNGMQRSSLQRGSSSIPGAPVSRSASVTASPEPTPPESTVVSGGGAPPGGITSMQALQERIKRLGMGV